MGAQWVIHNGWSTNLTTPDVQSDVLSVETVLPIHRRNAREKNLSRLPSDSRRQVASVTRTIRCSLSVCHVESTRVGVFSDITALNHDKRYTARQKAPSIRRKFEPSCEPAAHAMGLTLASMSKLKIRSVLNSSTTYMKNTWTLK